MSLMTKEQLLENLAKYGYPLLEPESDKPEEVLKTLLEQKDYRFLEGFPVVFVNALRAKDQLEWETSDWSPNFYSKRAKTLLPHLLAFTLLLFKFYKVGETFERRTSKLLSKFRSGKKIRIAFANPEDSEAKTAMQIALEAQQWARKTSK